MTSSPDPLAPGQLATVTVAIQAVNGPFVLGMDRDDRLITERHALYRALADVDLKAIAALAATDADALLDAGAAKGRIDAVEGYARPVAGRTARRLFGVTQPDDRTFHEVARAIFAHTFLNLGGDKAIAARAVKAAGLMHGWLQAEIERRRAGKIDLPDFMGALLRQGLVDDDGVRRTVGGMLVGSIDTTATAVAKIMVVLGRDARLAEAVRRDAHDLVLTRGWCLEALRRWPHNPLVLRQATADTTLDGVAVPAGSQVRSGSARTQARTSSSRARAVRCAFWPPTRGVMARARSASRRMRPTLIPGVPANGRPVRPNQPWPRVSLCEPR